MFTGFDKALFRNPEFKEDSVREVIIAPMLTRLGYFPAGIDRVIRSKSLAHPFIYVGTRKHPVTIIPDYTLLRNETPLFVLDAKHPSEDILSRDNVQQAYSYAIHPEIKARSFGLCNGRKLAVFSVDNNKPQLVVEFDEYVARWEEIASYMAPRHLANPTLAPVRARFRCGTARLRFVAGE